MKKVLIKSMLMFLAMMLFTMYGCGEKDKSEVPVKIEEIEWSVEEREIDGEKTVVFAYTNNSDYPISHLSMSFRQNNDESGGVKSIEEFEYMEPDVMNIDYVDNDTIYTAENEQGYGLNIMYGEYWIFVDSYKIK